MSPTRPTSRSSGRAYFSVDPGLPANRAVVDLDKAARNAAGQVEFSSDLVSCCGRNRRRPATGPCSSKSPIAAARACSTRSTAATSFSSTAAITLVWLGWQFDVPDRPELLRLYAPIAKGVTGLVRAEIVVDRREMTHSVADRNHRPYPVLQPDDPTLTLTVRDRVDGPRQTVPRARLAHRERDHVAMKDGFEPGRLYELVYTAQDPPVAGLGMAAIRDFISYLKYGGAPEMPVKRAIGFGVSQSGRFLRAYLYDGFNQDEKNRKVFDGVMAHVAGGGPRQLQRALRAAFARRPSVPQHALPDRPLPVHGPGGDRPGDRRQRRPARPRRQARGLAQDLLHQLLVRILRARCGADPQLARRQEGRAARAQHARLLLRRRTARTRRLPAAAQRHAEQLQSESVHVEPARHAGGDECLDHRTAPRRRPRTIRRSRPTRR